MIRVRSVQTALLLATDLVAILCAWGAARWVRVHLGVFFVKDFTRSPLSRLMPSLTMTLSILLLSLAAFGLYRVPRRMAPGYLMRVFNSATLGVMGLVTVMFFFTRNMYSRSLMGLFWIGLIAFLLAGRWTALSALRWLKERDVGAERVAVIGTGRNAAGIADRLLHKSEARFHFAGYVFPGDPGWSGVPGSAPCLGVTADLPKLINRKSIDRLIVAEAGLSQDLLASVARTCNRMGVSLEFVPDALGFISSTEVEVSDLDGIPLIVFQQIGFTRWQETVKRSVDLLGAVLAGALLLPFLVVVAIAVRLDSRGPVFFTQKRIGKGGKAFVLYKFRTMFQDAERRRREVDKLNETDGYIFKIGDDPRVTRVGRLLRRLSLDELPQLINVFRGEMSLVGPRPLPMADLPEDSSGDRYQLWLESRAGVLPGITGLWQIRGRSDLTFDEMVRLDLYYIENWSLRFDLEIMLRTIPAVVLFRGAY